MVTILHGLGGSCRVDIISIQALIDLYTTVTGLIVDSISNILVSTLIYALRVFLHSNGG